MSTAVVLMSETEAREITGRIDTLVLDAVAGLDEASVLLLEAKEREAWRTLGYKSWGAYVDERQSIGRQYSYRLLDQGRVIRALTEIAGEPIHVTERQARPVARRIPEVVAHGRQFIEQGEEPQAAAQHAIEHVRHEPIRSVGRERVTWAGDGCGDPDDAQPFRCPHCNRVIKQQLATAVTAAGGDSDEIVRVPFIE